METFLLLPLWVHLAFIFGFGVIIGSFLNVFLYRFHTGKSLSGHSHCLSCGQGLRVYELVPLLSYVFLRGRCARCRAIIPGRYFMVELLTGLLFVAVYLTSPDVTIMSIMFGFVTVLVVTAVYDLYHLIIPDEFIFTLTGLALVFQGYQLYQGQDYVVFLVNLGVAFLGSLFLFFLWHGSQGKWIGFGDVKLALPLGMMVGSTGVFSMVVLAFWSGAIIGLSLLLVQYLKRRGQKHLRFLPARFTMKTAVPFAPFLIIGFLQVFFFGVDVIDLLTYAN